MLNASMCVTTRGSPPPRGGLGIPCLRNLGRESTLVKVPCSLYAIMAMKKEGAPGSRSKETSITVEITTAFCCKQLIKTKLFTAWVNLYTLLVALRRVRVSCTGQWCLSSATLPSVKLGHLSSCLCGCSTSPCHCFRHSLSGLPHTGLPERLEKSALGSKGATARVSTPHTQCASKYRGQMGHWSVLCLGAILFSSPIIFIFSLENRHLS